MDLMRIRPAPLRRAVAIAILPVGFVVCIGIALWLAVKEFAAMAADTPEEFMRVWRGPEPTPRESQ